MSNKVTIQLHRDVDGEDRIEIQTEDLEIEHRLVGALELAIDGGPRHKKFGVKQIVRPSVETTHTGNAVTVVVMGTKDSVSVRVIVPPGTLIENNEAFSAPEYPFRSSMYNVLVLGGTIAAEDKAESPTDSKVLTNQQIHKLLAIMLGRYHSGQPLSDFGTLNLAAESVARKLR